MGPFSNKDVMDKYFNGQIQALAGLAIPPRLRSHSDHNNASIIKLKSFHKMGISMLSASTSRKKINCKQKHLG